MPSISATPDTLDFGSVPPGHHAVATVAIGNGGDPGTALEIDALTVDLLGATLVDPPSLPVILTDGQTLVVTIDATPLGPLPNSGRLVIVSDNATNSPYAVIVLIVAPMPHVSVSPPDLDFGAVPVGSTVERAITLHNSGDATYGMTITALDLDIPGISLLDPPTLPFELLGVASLELTIAATAIDGLDQNGALTIDATNADNVPLALPIAMTSRPPNQPPLCDPGGPYRAPPREMIRFDGRASTDDYGPLDYEWQFGGGAVVRSPRVSWAFDGSGLPRVTLCVTDVDGLTSCCRASVTIDRDATEEACADYTLLPRTVALLDVDSEITALASVGEIVYAGGAALRVFDVSLPGDLEEVGVVPGIDGVRVLKVFGSRLYALSRRSLAAFDVSNATSPRLLWSTPAGNDGTSMAVNARWLVVGSGGSFLVFENNGDAPANLASTTPMGEAVHDLIVENDVTYMLTGHLYFSSWWTNLDIMGLSDPANPERIAHHKVGSDRYFSKLGDRIYAYQRIWDVSNPSELMPTSEFDFVMGRLVPIAGGWLAVTTHGVQLVDLHDPGRPQWVGEMTGLGRASTPFMTVDGYLLVAGQAADFRYVIYVIDPGAPGEFPTQAAIAASDDFVAMAASDRYFVEAASRELTIFDLETEETPRVVDLGGTIGGVAVTDDHAYTIVSQGSDRSDLIVTDLTRGVPLARIRQLGARSIAAADGTVVVITDSGLSIIDTADPAQPVVSGALAMEGLRDVALVEAMAFAATPTTVQAIDISDRTAPRRRDNINFNRPIAAFDANGPRLYVRTAVDGLWCIDSSDPDNLVIIDVRPELRAGTVHTTGSHLFVGPIVFENARLSPVERFRLAGATALAHNAHSLFARIWRGPVVAIPSPCATGEIAAMPAQGGMLLRWHVPPANIAGFHVWRSDDGASFHRVTDAPVPWSEVASITHIDRQGLQLGGSYAYRLEILDRFGYVIDGPGTAPVAIPIGAFLDVAVTTDPADGSVLLTWQSDYGLEGLDVAIDRITDAATERITHPTVPAALRAFRDEAPFETTTRYVLTAIPRDGTDAVALPPVAAQPARFAIRRASPNPLGAGDALQLRAELPRSAGMRLRVWDVQGRLIREIRRNALPPGVATIDWDGRNANGARVAAGVYFYRIELGTTASTERLVIVR